MSSARCRKPLQRQQKLDFAACKMAATRSRVVTTEPSYTMVVTNRETAEYLLLAEVAPVAELRETSLPRLSKRTAALAWCVLVRRDAQLRTPFQEFGAQNPISPKPVLAAVGDIATGTNEQAQTFLDCDTLPRFPALLTHPGEGIRKPIVVPECLHVFCSDCYQRLFAKESPKCPLDMLDVSADETKKFVLGENQRKLLLVRCLNAEHGCKFEGPFGDLEAHYTKECNFHVVTCKRGFVWVCFGLGGTQGSWIQQVEPVTAEQLYRCRY
ncbi:hypothetical protein HPB47_013827 [Ixodes persulcatus]|uniref:Uncharacterized protein n=1 Tax=Ixodes persulcatus TaxID=34615 RepID=A0AC60R3M6_IXOPE|nr:hypothetical protein HPB47_013827 [Ixodes persulcatus]